MDPDMSMPGMVMGPTTSSPASGMVASVTSALAAATSGATAANSTTGAGMAGMGGGSGCKISMLWNWNTVDACFLTSHWRITSTGMFAGSCIGVILLAVALEALRRSFKEFDRHLLRAHAARHLDRHQQPHHQDTTSAAELLPVSSSAKAADAKLLLEGTVAAVAAAAAAVGPAGCSGAGMGVGGAIPPFRPSVLQQAARAALHTLQFAVAYFLMLLAMYYNGYFITCIFVGAFLGAMAFQWETFHCGAEGGERTSAAGEATVCCG